MNKKIKKRIKSCALALAMVTTTLTANLSISASASDVYPYTIPSLETLKSTATANASKGDYGLTNTLSYMDVQGTLFNANVFSKINIPTAQNGTTADTNGFVVNANGQNAENRNSTISPYDTTNNYTFYMYPPSESNSYVYSVSRLSGSTTINTLKTYTFNKANNWGWGDLETGNGGIRYIPGVSNSSDNSNRYGLFSFNVFETTTTDKSATTVVNPSNNNCSQTATIGNRVYTYNGYVTSMNNTNEDKDIYPKTVKSEANMFLKYRWTVSDMTELLVNSIGGEGKSAQKKYWEWQNSIENAKETSAKREELKQEYNSLNKHSGWGIALTEEDKGTLSCTYKKVGKWGKQDVDVKLTLMDYTPTTEFNRIAVRDFGSIKTSSINSSNESSWSYQNVPAALRGANDVFTYCNYTRYIDGKNQTYNGNMYRTHPLFSFQSRKVGVDFAWADSVQLKYEFFNSSTGEQITDIKGRSTWKDIDNSQSVSFAPNSNGKEVNIYDYDKSVTFKNDFYSGNGPSSSSNLLVPAGVYDPLMYKTWNYHLYNPTTKSYNKTPTKLKGCFDWLGDNAEDKWQSQWIYVEFEKDLNVVYTANGHRKITGTTDGVSVGVDDTYTEWNVEYSSSDSSKTYFQNKKYTPTVASAAKTLSNPTYSAEWKGIHPNQSAQLGNELSSSSFVGKMTIQKNVETLASSEAQAMTGKINPDEIYFAVKDSNGKYMAFVKNESTNTYEYKDGIIFETPDSSTLAKLYPTETGKVNIDGLPAGYYAVEEYITGSNFTDKGAEWEYKLNGATKDMTNEDPYVQIINGGTTAVTVVNQEKIGDLEIDKLNSDGTAVPAGIAFTLTGTSDGGTIVNRTIKTGDVLDCKTNTSRGKANDYQAILLNVPCGTYKLDEVESTIPEGYLKGTMPDKIVITEASANINKYTITNILATGPIKITKKLTEAYYDDEQFVFEVTDKGKDGTQDNKFLVLTTVNAGDTSATVTVDNCKYGHIYEVKELNTNWRYKPVTSDTKLFINDEGLEKLTTDDIAKLKYSYSDTDNAMTFTMFNCDNDYNCIFTNKGHDYWLDDTAHVTNNMKSIT